MARKISPMAYAELINQARIAIPDVAITTDIITGFPGETQDEFAESMEFIKEMDFAAGHVFTYSPRPGTAACCMPDKVPFAIAKKRNALIRKILQQSASAFRGRHINQVLSVLVERVSPLNDHLWQLNGLSDNYLRVQTTAPTPCWNQIVSVQVSGIDQHALQGEILNA